MKKRRPTKLSNHRTTSNKGLFALRTPPDLLAKLKHDCRRLESNPLDSYAAFDFLVTAFHMKEWVEASGQPVGPSTPNEEQLIKTCGYLANGAKHFSFDRHSSVRLTEHLEGAFDPVVFDSGAFQTEHLVVYLEAEASNELGNSIDAVSLAQKVLAFWESKVK